jgi:short subunit dehydrogenase-like uncharacterized protein
MDLALGLHVAYRVSTLEEEREIDSALAGVAVLLHCAGRFLQTVGPLMSACIRNKVHYLDISPKLDGYLMASLRNDDAEKAKVMLLPGCSGSVTMLG